MRLSNFNHFKTTKGDYTIYITLDKISENKLSKVKEQMMNLITEILKENC